MDLEVPSTDDFRAKNPDWKFAVVDVAAAVVAAVVVAIIGVVVIIVASSVVVVMAVMIAFWRRSR